MIVSAGHDDRLTSKSSRRAPSFSVIASLRPRGVHRSLCLLLSLVVLASGLGMRIFAQASADTALYAVSYVEVLPSARAAMATALKQYRDTSRRENGYVRFDMLEQVGRPGHFVILETWKDQKAFDTHGVTAHVKAFQDALQSLRLSDYDQRSYKTLTVASTADVGNGQAIYVVTHVDTVGGGQTDAPGLLTRLAEASRKEQGCLRFDVVQHTMRANHFTVIEIWQNQKTHDAHAAALHTKQYRNVLQPMSGSPLDERLFKVVE
jgi:quinol monooxygenase YgiN